MTRFLLYISIILFTLPLTLSARGDQRYLIEKISSLDGLNQNDVQSIIEDSYGFIWVATNDGLCRYDGYDFLKFTAGNLGLTSNLILGLDEDRDKNIWINSSDNGLYCYIRSENRFFHYSELIDPSFNIKLSTLRFAIDSDGYIWSYKGRASTIERLTFDNDSQRITAIDRYALEGDGFKNVLTIQPTESDLFLGANNGVYRFSERDNLFEYLSSDAPIPAVNAVSQRGNMLYLATPNRLLTLDMRIGVVKEQLKIDGVFLFDWRGDEIWIASKEGVFKTRYDAHKNSFSKLHCVEIYNNLTARVVIADSANSIWIGFQKVGIRRYERENIPIQAVNGIGNDHITHILQKDCSKLYIGTAGSGLYLLDSTAQRVESIPQNTVYSIIEVGQSLFVSTTTGVYRVDGGNTKRILNDSSIRKITHDGDYLWLACYEKGLMCYNINSGEIIKEIALPSNIARNIMLDREQNLWVCTSKGVVKIDGESRFADDPIIEHISPIEDEHYAIPIIEDSRGGIWYGTLNLGLFHLSDGTTTHYTESNGLTSNKIMAIEEDRSGAIWISTNRGLNQLVVESDTTKIFSYDIEDGLQDNEFSELASTTLCNGEILFGGIAGFNHFDPSQFERDEIAPRPMITDFEINRESVYRCNMVEEGIILQQNQQDITIKFAGLHFSNPSKQSYKYMLEGYDKGWSLTMSDNREVNYTNLRSGRYRFLLKCANRDGVWSEEMLSMNITVMQPIWLRWYSITLYALLLIAAIRYFTTRGRKEEKTVDHPASEQNDIALYINLCDSAITNIDKLFLTKIIAYIEENMGNSELVVSDLCNHMGVTQFILNKRLKSLINTTAVTLIKTARLHRASELLKSSRNTVSDVAYDVGFNDIKNFRASFKSKYGVSPQEYKRMQSEL